MNALRESLKSRRCWTCTACYSPKEMQGYLWSSSLDCLMLTREVLLTLRFDLLMVFNSLYKTYQEFLIATDMPTSGTPKEKLQWIFEMYDSDGSG